MYKLVFFVPIDSAEIVKQAVFGAGAGRIGNYQQCCFQTKGMGQFQPLENANPAIGQIGELAIVEELKIEMVCSDDNIKKAVDALKMSHPYETPAYEVYQLIEF